MSNGIKIQANVYFPQEMLEELRREADRLDRSLSSLIQEAWLLSRDRLRGVPAVREYARGYDTAPAEGDSYFQRIVGEPE